MGTLGPSVYLVKAWEFTACSFNSLTGARGCLILFIQKMSWAEHPCYVSAIVRLLHAFLNKHGCVNIFHFPIEPVYKN